jgi:PAS domain S-box-containing protein
MLLTVTRPRGFGHRFQVLLLVTGALLFGSADLARAQVQRVVVLYDERVELPGLSALDAGLTSNLSVRPPVRLEIYRETLDLSRFGNPEYLLKLRDHLQVKYASTRIDMLIAALGPSLDFLLEHGASIFAETPIVFCGLDRTELANRALPAHVTGVLMKRQFRPTLELALRLHPETRQVVFISGTSSFDVRLRDKAKQELSVFEDKLTFTYLTDLTMPALLAAVADLPARTVVLYSTLFRDGAGQSFVSHEVARLIANASSAPVYAFVDQYLDRGVVGGHMYSINAHGKAAALLATQVLAGRAPASLPMTEVGSSADLLDWRQLQRWRINPARVPSSADIRNRPRTVWDQYRWHILGIFAFAVLQTLIIAALIVERTGRRRSEKRYALASAGGRVGVCDWNLITNQVYIDPILKTILGYEDHEIRNQLSDWLELMHPDDAPIVASRAQEVLSSKSDQVEVEHRMVHRDGNILWFLSRGTVVRKNGCARRITGTVSDITARKSSEQQLDLAQAELTRVSRLTALGEFGAAIAHEVRQPLTAITLNAQTSLRLLTRNPPNLDEIRAALQDVVRDSKHAAELIRRNRELFRLHTVRKEPIDINAVVGEVALLARQRLQNSQVSLIACLTPDLSAVHGDRLELEQVLLNLIANAIDATQARLPRSRRVEISTAAVNDSIEIAVRDNGIGLETVDMQQLFKLSYTTKPNGTGIGLSLCRSIIEAHGGRIWAEPNEGPGATFRFTVPCAQAPETTAPVLPLSGERIREIVPRERVLWG